MKTRILLLLVTGNWLMGDTVPKFKSSDEINVNISGALISDPYAIGWDYKECQVSIGGIAFAKTAWLAESDTSCDAANFSKTPNHASAWKCIGQFLKSFAAASTQLAEANHKPRGILLAKAS